MKISGKTSKFFIVWYKIRGRISRYKNVSKVEVVFPKHLLIKQKPSKERPMSLRIPFWNLLVIQISSRHARMELIMSQLCLIL